MIIPSGTQQQRILSWFLEVAPNIERDMDWTAQNPGHKMFEQFENSQLFSEGDMQISKSSKEFPAERMLSDTEDGGRMTAEEFSVAGGQLTKNVMPCDKKLKVITLLDFVKIRHKVKGEMSSPVASKQMKVLKDNEIPRSVKASNKDPIDSRNILCPIAAC